MDTIFLCVHISFNNIQALKVSEMKVEKDILMFESVSSMIHIEVENFKENRKDMDQGSVLSRHL